MWLEESGDGQQSRASSLSSEHVFMEQLEFIYTSRYPILGRPTST